MKWNIVVVKEENICIKEEGGLDQQLKNIFHYIKILNCLIINMMANNQCKVKVLTSFFAQNNLR